MGIPYSKQINAAFDEVTPLVAAGFDVLRTSRNISILLAVIQILTVIILSFLLLATLALMITVNPDLEYERQALVTPAVKWLSGWIIDRAWFRVAVWTVILGAALGGYGGWYITKEKGITVQKESEKEVTGDDDNADGVGEAEASKNSK